MVGKIVRFEWLLHRRSRYQSFLLFLMLGLIVLIMTLHWDQKNVLETAQAEWQETLNELWANQPDRHPHRVSHYGQVVVRPVPPLSFIESGIVPFVGNYLFLEAHRQNSSSIRNSPISPLEIKLGIPSVATLIIIFWPFVLFVLGFGVFSEEWDSGRMNWIATLGVKFWKLALGKGLIYLIYSAILLIFTLLLSSFYLAMESQLSFNNFIRLSELFLIFFVYSCIWVLILLYISFRSRDSSQSLWRLLTLWFALVVFIPMFASTSSEILYPVPQRAVFEAKLEKAVHEVGNSHNPDDPYFSDFKKQILSKYNAKSIEELPVNWNGLVMAEGERITSKIFSEQFKKITDQYESQLNFQSYFGFISPVIWIRQISMLLTDTDRVTAEEFESQAEKFRFNLIQKLNEIHTNDVDKKNDKAYKASSEIWKQFEMFKFEQKPNKKLGLITTVTIFFWLMLSVFLFFKIKKQEIYR